MSINPTSTLTDHRSWASGHNKLASKSWEATVNRVHKYPTPTRRRSPCDCYGGESCSYQEATYLGRGILPNVAHVADRPEFAVFVNRVEREPMTERKTCNIPKPVQIWGCEIQHTMRLQYPSHFFQREDRVHP